MITSHFDWEEQLAQRRAQRTVNAMISPSVEDTIEVAKIERLK